MENQIFFDAFYGRGYGHSDFSVGLNLNSVGFHRNVDCRHFFVGKQLKLFGQFVNRAFDGFFRHLNFFGYEFSLFPEVSAGKRNSHTAFQFNRFAAAAVATVATCKKAQA